MTRQIKENILAIQQSIAKTCAKSGRKASEVMLLAVSKTKPVEDIEAAYAAGQTDFGENYLQEAIAKIATLKSLPLQWHFIGRIQSNKTRPIAEHFDWVHTVASYKHARRLSEQRPPELPELNICIQVNISEEPNKSGVLANEALALIEQASELPRIKLRGLMTIPEATTNTEKQRQFFRQLAELQANINAHGFSLDTLSMGMSGDLQIAVEEGSTIVRIGTAIFGKREMKP
jgi:pyridoxal phosphate enzyme (YggS family)